VGERAEEDPAIYALLDLASLACGGHAGDDASLEMALSSCRTHRVQAGAHPSYPDRPGFGRRPWPHSETQLSATLRTQLRAFARAAAAQQVEPHHVKAHGALYHAADRDPVVAQILVATTRSILGPVRVIAQPGGFLAREAGDALLSEGFADRRYGADGRIVGREAAGSVLGPEDAAAQALRLAGRFDTLCVHGDRDDALDVARAVRGALGPRA
jgi:UPF0271 protein